jgi:CRISPR/Cas system-associated exonuclease Cas4 (RecB family)
LKKENKLTTLILKMAFSEKQDLFLDYLLRKIGFKNQDLIDKYKNKLEAVHGIYEQRHKTIHYGNGNSYDQYYYKFINSGCIEVILSEIEIKKDLGSISTIEFLNSAKISATDLSSFTFCSASFTIKKSFEIKYPTGEEALDIGSDFHESLRLINKKFPKGSVESDFIDYNVQENNVIKKIKSCKLIFAGHANEKESFENKSKNYIGQPDYIFKDPRGDYFVVEEKFKYLSSYYNPDHNDWKEIEENNEIIKNTFFSNNIIQLASYLEFIEEYELKYGVLIYWFYSFIDDKPYIHDFSYKVVKVGEYSKQLNSTLLNLINLIKKKKSDFADKINPNKCISCSVNKYCAHKTNEIDTLSFPYSKNDLKLRSIPFPEKLKKS